MEYILDADYEKLQDYANTIGKKYKLQQPDIEDFLSNAVLKILEQQVPREKWKKKIFSEMGNHIKKLKKQAYREVELNEDLL